MSQEETDEDWTLAIERVLLAETADLRALAVLAGADPATFYIGTRMDGVDVRGQDLRGMAFSDLDLAHVRHDEGTLLDPSMPEIVDDTESQLDFFANHLLVLIASRLADLSKIERQLSPFRFTIFDFPDADLFFSQLREGRTGLIVVFEPELEAVSETLRTLDPGDGEALVIVQGPEERARFEMAMVHRAPTVVCHHPARTKPSERFALGAETRSFITLLNAYWGDLRHALSPFSIYLSAQGIGAMPVVDAAAQLYDRIWMSHSNHPDRRLLGNLSDDGQVQAKAAQELLRTDFQNIDYGPAGLLHLLIDVTPFVRVSPHVTLVGEYEAAIQLAVARLRRYEGRGGDYVYDVEGEPLELMELAHFTPPARTDRLSNSAVNELTLSQIQLLVLSEPLEVRWVVREMANHRRLWICGRDLLSAAWDDRMTVWSLMAGQLRRFASRSGGQARRQYLALLFREALARDPGLDPAWRGVLAEERTAIYVENFQADAGGARFDFTLSYPIDKGWSAKRGHFELNALGPRLSLPPALS